MSSDGKAPLASALVRQNGVRNGDALPIIFAPIDRAAFVPLRPISVPELRQMFLTALNWQGTRATYVRVVDDLMTLAESRHQPISRAVVMEYRSALITRRLSSSSINGQLSAICKACTLSRCFVTPNTSRTGGSE